MSPARKVRATRRHRHTRRWIVVVSVLLIIVTLLTVAYLWYPKNESNAVNNDPAFKAFTDHYLGIMKNLNSSETKAEMAAQLDPSCNQTDLFTWEQSKLTFTQDPAGWFEDPTQILNSGDGICVQWSIVYVSACLALGYQSRLVVAADTTGWSFIHVWAEDYYNGTWVHVDPSDRVWNNPSRYQSWDWGSAIGSGVKIYAFEDGTFQDVTATYSAHSS
ncbi:MAG: transglutaminase-like domain-containing protein [Candidatus Bathyarchaeia archaeon]|jgi:transglutaminase-like putative cysteine protease